MPLDIKDKGYIWDIVDACKDVIAFTGGLRYEEFYENKLVRFAKVVFPDCLGPRSVTTGY